MLEVNIELDGNFRLGSINREESVHRVSDKLIVKPLIYTSLELYMMGSNPKWYTLVHLTISPILSQHTKNIHTLTLPALLHRKGVH